MSFTSSKYDLAELYENEFLNSEFVKLSAELHNEYEFERTQRFILNYNNGKIIGNIILKSAQRRRIYNSNQVKISYVTWNEEFYNKNPKMITEIINAKYIIVPELNGRPIELTKNSSNFPAKLTIPGMIIP